METIGVVFAFFGCSKNYGGWGGEVGRKKGEKVQETRGGNEALLSEDGGTRQ